MKNDAIDKKIKRLKQGESPRLLDLFAGCGGISLGFQAAGFKIEAALEIDELAALSHAQNFYRGYPEEVVQLHAKAHDITKTEPEELVEELNLGPVEDAFDILVGGPPCQAYARVGRAKLREVADHPEAFKVDPRANLYLRYLHYIKAAKPIAILMENVPDIMNFGGHNIVEEIRETLHAMGYEAKYSLINSAHHTVPQMRDRVFLIAFHRKLGATIRFPEASRRITLPQGYEGTRQVALKYIGLFESGGYVPADTGNDALPFAVTALDALDDLPPITLHLEGKLKRGARRFTELTPYRKMKHLSAYAKLMREWPGFENVKGVKDHVLRCLPRDTDIFRNMKSGDEYPAAHRVAVTLYEREIERRESEGQKLSKAERDKLYRAMVPPYPIGSFPNRWWKLRPDWPSRTLMAHLGKDTYSHIHYDSNQARVISVREAARLQSFPDGFIFSGTMNPAFRQIGNAVPPLMAKAIADVMMASIAKSLNKADKPDMLAVAS